nr:NAD(P)/FAD-dependent oxidoreductase [Helicobacter kayseriensis]
MSPLSLLQAKDLKYGIDTVYPPSLAGLRGSNNESYRYAHMIRDGEKFNFDNLQTEENYDLVVVGAGISGLCAACIFQDKKGKKAKILILDNHDDFGGHARRNEFHLKDRMILSYGGSESLQSPKTLYSKEVVEFLQGIGIDIDALAKAFDVDFYPNLGLGRGVYFNKKDYGVDRVVSGNPRKMVADDIPEDRINGRSYADFIGNFPMSAEDKKQLLDLHQNPKDYLAGMSLKQREEYVAKTSYKRFLEEKVKLSPMAISFFEGMTDDFLALGIDSISCEDARISFLPGFEKLGLPPLSKEEEAEVSEPYIYHFPDGNATIARMMVKKLIPSVTAAKQEVEEIVMAKFDYSQLDHSSSPVRLRLNSTVVRVNNHNDGGEVFYMSARDNRIHKVFAKKVVMANYNSMIPYIIPDLPIKQKESLAQCVKTPLIHTKVILRNWESFRKLGVHEIYSPKMFYARTKLDYPVDIGDYKHPRDPKEPICVHMVGAPITLIRGMGDGETMNARDQSRLARHLLLDLSFSELERMTREQLQGMLGDVGFDHQKDILAITINRWGHCYSYTFNSLYDDEKESEHVIEVAKKKYGNIAIANCDAAWNAYAHSAIEEAIRSIRDLEK